MRTTLLSLVFLFIFSNITFSQKQNLKLVADIGKVFETHEWQGNIRSGVLPIIFAKLDKKYTLLKRNKQIDDTLVKLIEQRRSYSSYGKAAKLMYRANDHLIALVLGPPPATTSRA
ncbi:MAG: hypothetical protein AAF242_16195, partial [Bacteroidota bacterium]